LRNGSKPGAVKPPCEVFTWSILMRRVRNAIREWYEGETTAVDNPSGSPVIVIGVRVKRHWTARIAVVIIEFHRRDWKWALPFYLAALGFLLRVLGAI
jgi:hypothetical protein